jgi:hypothetical protein
MLQQFKMADFATMSELAKTQCTVMQNMFGGKKLLFGDMEKAKTCKKKSSAMKHLGLG